MSNTPRKKHQKLGEAASTAICGNDIMSSVLYVSGITIGVAIVYAPLILLGIGEFFYFTEVSIVKLLRRFQSTAEPTTPSSMEPRRISLQPLESSQSSLTSPPVSFLETAVEYLNTIVSIPVIPITIAVLGAFALLVISGVKDSAKVAMGIFFPHLLTLIAFVGMGSYYLLHNPSQFPANIAFTDTLLQDKSLLVLLFGLPSSLLGVSGFESSAHFVEEQQKGVFKKTLTNMLVGVAILNPVVAFLLPQYLGNSRDQ